MYPYKLATVAAVVGIVSAKLLMFPFLSTNQLPHLRQQGQASVVEENAAQRPLNIQFGDSDYIDKLHYEAGQFTRTKQDGTFCASYGESHWTGTIDVTDSRRLFFSAIESRNDPETDPVMFWMNGGPGGSSMEGHFVEMGPCWLGEDANITVPNEWSWNNNATLVFLDQPAGVGFSSVAPGATPPGQDIDGAEDFQTFLNLFFSKVFPEKAHLPIVIAAESYGGHYGPTYLSHILESRRHDSPMAFRGNITGMILVDALLDFTGPMLGMYQLLCEDESGKGIITEEECASMRVEMPECELLGRACDLAKDGRECLGMMTHCEEKVNGPYLKRVISGERSPYHRHRSCWGYAGQIDCPVPDRGNISAYLNQPKINKALNLSPSYEFLVEDFDLNQRYLASSIIFQPTSHLVSAILDAHRTPKLGKPDEPVADIKILILNGNEDAVINTYGNMWVYDRVLWSGQAEYRAASWKEIPEDEVEATGTWKATRDGRLAFVAVDDAGHMVPGDVREGSYKIVQKWLNGDWHF